MVIQSSEGNTSCEITPEKFTVVHLFLKNYWGDIYTFSFIVLSVVHQKNYHSD